MLADVVGAGLAGSVRLVALGEDENACGLAGAVGQDDGAADLLVGVTGVDAQLDVQLDGLVELGGSGLARPGPKPSWASYCVVRVDQLGSYPYTFYL